MTRQHSLLFTLAATSLVVVACGASVPTKPEAVAALSPAIESTLTRTLPSATYCSTTTPDFSFANMGQIDFVEMLQNLKDKEPLYDATTAGVVRVELKEFRFDPAGRSPHPSCDAVHAQSRQGGYTSGQVRLAVVRTTLTPKGTAAGIQLVGIDTPSIDHGPSRMFFAHRELYAANIPALENVAHLDQLPPTGAVIFALPMKIRGGSGGPLRVVAAVPR